jgi:hypothetical protein
MTKPLIEKCSLCRCILDDDNQYGEKDYPLCKEHSEKVAQLVAFLCTVQEKKDIFIANLRLTNIRTKIAHGIRRTNVNN